MKLFHYKLQYVLQDDPHAAPPLLLQETGWREVADAFYDLEQGLLPYVASSVLVVNNGSIPVRYSLNLKYQTKLVDLLPHGQASPGYQQSTYDKVIIRFEWPDGSCPTPMTVEDVMLKLRHLPSYVNVGPTYIVLSFVRQGRVEL